MYTKRCPLALSSGEAGSPNCVRISYVSEENLIEVVKRMKKSLAKLQ